MVHYLLTAQVVEELLPELKIKLKRKEFQKTYFLGKHVSESITMARKKGNQIVLEMPDYCVLPATTERVEILNKYFHDINVKIVHEGEGWIQIADLPRLFPDIEIDD